MTFRDHNFCIKLLFVSRTFSILFIYSLLNFCFIFYAKFLVEGHAYIICGYQVKPSLKKASIYLSL